MDEEVSVKSKVSTISQKNLRKARMKVTFQKTMITTTSESEVMINDGNDIMTTHTNAEIDGGYIIHYVESHPDLEEFKVEQVFHQEEKKEVSKNSQNNDDDYSDSSCDSEDVDDVIHSVNIDRIEQFLNELDDLTTKNYTTIHFKSIELPRNNIDGTMDHCQPLARILRNQQQTLQKLDLSSNPIGPKGIQDLFETATSTSFSNLTVLNLNSCKLSSTKAATTLSNLIRRQNRTIRELHVSNNDLGTKGINILAPDIASSPVLEVLDVSYNKLKSKGGSVLAKAIMSSSGSTRLRSLNVTCNKIGSTGMQSFAKLLSTNTTLEEFYVGSNNLGFDGACMITSILKVNYKLRILNIADNQIGDNGLEILAHIDANFGGALVENETRGPTSLEQLDLSWNNIGDDGATTLASVLEKNSKLSRIDLTGNQICDDGIIAMANSLAYNNTLSELIAGQNKWGTDGAFALTLAISKPTCHITSLVFEDNANIDQEGFKALSRIPQIRSNLLLWFNDILKSLSKGRVNSIDLRSKVRYIGDEELLLLCQTLVEHRPIMKAIWISSGGGKAASYGKERRSTAMAQSATMITTRGIVPIIDYGIGSSESNIERIYLKDFTNMGDEIAHSFRHALCENESLEVLSITDSSMTAVGAADIAHGLSQNTKLRRLNLDRNQIGDKGMGHLSAGLLSKGKKGKHHPSLVSLSVCNNNLSDKAMSDCGQSLKLLQELFLNWNYITNSGALDFCKFLESPSSSGGDDCCGADNNCRLVYVSLRGTTISRIGIATIQNFLPSTAVVDY